MNKNPVGSRFWIGPLYIRRQDPVTSAALFPLFYYTRDDKAKTSTSFVLPLWLQTRSPERSVTMVTPLFWHERTLMRRISVLFPLVLDVHHLHSDRLTAVGPLVPLVVRYADYAAKTTSWVFPPILTYVKRRADGYHNAVVFPLLWHFGGKDRSTTVLFPLFYHVRRPATQFTALLPFFAYSRDEHGTRSLLLPPLLTWVRNYENGSRDRVVFPFLWHFKRPKQTTTVFFPIGAHWSNERATTRWCSTATTTRALASGRGLIGSSSGRSSMSVGLAQVTWSGASCRASLATLAMAFVGPCGCCGVSSFRWSRSERRPRGTAQAGGWLRTANVLSSDVFPVANRRWQRGLGCSFPEKSLVRTSYLMGPSITTWSMCCG